MPSMLEMSKDYIIESENDIPQKYREEIEKRLSSQNHIEEKKPEIISGKRGKVISKKSEIEDMFKCEQNFYFGHGTCGGEETINSILKNGLNTVNSEAMKGYGNTLRGLYSTSIGLGEGRDYLFSEQIDLLENWPHKDSKDVIIISIPKKYALRNTEVGGMTDLYEPFYVGSEEEGYNLRPEFIMGIYNADSHTFIQNDNFYQNLDENKQEKIFEEIKNRYIKSYAEYSKVAPDEVTIPLPLNEKELEEVGIEWYKNQLEKFRKDKTFDSQMLDSELQEISEGYKISDFNATTNSIKEYAQEDKENTNEGWLLDDWE